MAQAEPPPDEPMPVSPPMVDLPYAWVSGQKALALHVRYATQAKTLRVTAFVDGEEQAVTYQFEIDDVFQAIGRLLSWVAASHEGSVMMVELSYLELMGNHEEDTKILQGKEK